MSERRVGICLNCDREARLFAGECRTCYQYRYRHGVARPEHLMVRQNMVTIEQYMQDRTDVRGPDECWVWLGSRKTSGYGVIKQCGPYLDARAHVVALSLVAGPRPLGHYAIHSCDNPPCVNPAHLRWGTPADNQRDAAKRGRCRAQRLKGTTTLRDEAVRRHGKRDEVVVLLRAKGPMRVNEIARALEIQYEASRRRCIRATKAGVMQKLEDGRYDIRTNVDTQTRMLTPRP